MNQLLKSRIQYILFSNLKDEDNRPHTINQITEEIMGAIQDQEPSNEASLPEKILFVAAQAWDDFALHRRLQAAAEISEEEYNRVIDHQYKIFKSKLYQALK